MHKIAILILILSALSHADSINELLAKQQNIDSLYQKEMSSCSNGSCLKMTNSKYKVLSKSIKSKIDKVRKASK